MSEPLADPNRTGDAPSRPAPKATIAVLLSLVATGLGQMYCGRLRRGLAFFLLSLMLAPVAALMAAAGLSTGTLVALVASVAASALVFVVAVVDAGLLARRVRLGSAAADRGPGALLYALFAIVGIVAPLASALYLRAHVVEAFYIPTGSMSPTLLPGDRILVDKAAYLFAAPRRGDVVVFRLPSSGTHFIRRVIALPGDRVEIRDGDVYVNETRLEKTRAGGDGPGVRFEKNGVRRYRILEDGPSEQPKDLPKETLAPDQYFLLSDRRAASHESLDYDRASERDLVGPATYVFWPAGSWSRLGPLE